VSDGTGAAARPHDTLLMIGALLIALTAGYLMVLRNFTFSEQPGERMFGAADSVAAAEVYLEPLSIDATNEGVGSSAPHSKRSGCSLTMRA
jgi:hypothetical protein